MEQEPKENRAVCSSAPATGCATKVDAALAWADDKAGTDWYAVRDMLGTHAADMDTESSKVAKILAAEVRRLRVERAAILADFADTVGNCEVWGDNPEEMRNVTREAKLRIESHNVKLNDGAKPQEVTNGN